MTLIRALSRVLRLTLAALGGIWSVMMMLLMAGSLALSVAMAVVPAVFAAVSGAVETVTGVRSLHSRQLARETSLADDLTRAERRAATEAAQRRAVSGRADNLARDLADSRAAQSRMARELADGPVVYRGTRMAAREAVKDTATRVARRTAVATSRNLGSMAAEALPAVGIGVIAAATAWELHDACQLMGEMRALDAAFNPDDPVTEDDICGITPPTRDQLWAAIKASPGAAWDKATAMYDGLPDLPSDPSAAIAGWAGAIAGLVHGGDPEAEAAAGPLPGRDAP